jgi:regulation of enolase protein 1 (concanavalin A-like superfamily)
MVRNRRTLFVALAVCSLTRTVFAEDQAPQVIKGFGTVVDPDGDCRFKADDGKLTITVPASHHDLTYQADTGKLNAPRVVQNAKGDFTLEVMASRFPLPRPNTSSSGRFSFVSTGLLIWQDDHNFIRMDRASEGNSGQSPFVWVERFQDGKSASHKLYPLDGDNDTFLRIERNGDRLTFEVSGDGKQWKEVQAEDAKLAPELKVGVLAINTTINEFAPVFSGLKLTENKK